MGGEENRWLIPDNVEEKDLLQVRRLSPTNLGMLLNARQAACELGFLTLPEFAEATLGTLETYERLEKHRGHIYNWYDIATLGPVAPLTISSVDSGNLAASFYTLHGGALQVLKRPVLSESMFAAFAARERGKTLKEWIAWLYTSDVKVSDDAGWVEEELQRRKGALRAYIEEYLPWLEPKFAPLMGLGDLQPTRMPVVEEVVEYIDELQDTMGKLGRESPLYGVRAGTGGPVKGGAWKGGEVAAWVQAHQQ